MFFYLVFKLARGDFHYWARVEGFTGIMISIFARLVAKVIADFTGCLHMRHPFELGKAGARGFENDNTSANHTAVLLTSSFLHPSFFFFSI